MKADRFLSAVLVLSALPVLAAQACPRFADLYKEQAFFWLSAVLRRCPAFLPGLIALTFLALCLILAQRHGKKRTLARLLCLVMMPYAILWAPLYGCTPLLKAASSSEALYRECLRLISEAEALRPSAQSAAQSLSLEDIRSEAERLASLECGQNLALSSCDLADSPAGALLAGIYFPLNGRAYINSDDLPLMLPFTMTHELAHQGGYARESEAGYAAWAACQRGSALFRFSGCFNMLLYGMEILEKADPAAHAQCLNAMDTALFELFVRCNGLKTAPETPLYRLSQAFSALFLRLNGQNADRDGYQNAMFLMMKARSISNL